MSLFGDQITVGNPDIPFCIFELLRCIPALAFYFFHDALPSLFFAAPRILCLAFLSLSGFPEPAFSCFKSKSKNLGRQLPFFFFFFFFLLLFHFLISFLHCFLFGIFLFLLYSEIEFSNNIICF